MDYNPDVPAPSPLGFILAVFIINSDQKFPGLVMEFVFVSVLFPFALHFPKFDDVSWILGHVIVWQVTSVLSEMATKTC